MHRQPLLRLLSRYQPWKEEGDILQRFTTFVNSHVQCFERTLAVGHVTGSAWVVDPNLTQVLLTHHVKLDKWLQLGGHADGDPNILQVAIREAEEESGLKVIQPLMDEIFDLDIHEIPARESEPRHFHYDVRFLVAADPLHSLHLTDESHDVRWVPFEELEKHTRETSMLRMLAKTNDWRTSK